MYYFHFNWLYDNLVVRKKRCKINHYLAYKEEISQINAKPNTLFSQVPSILIAEKQTVNNS
jgi:hypothetical protein